MDNEDIKTEKEVATMKENVATFWIVVAINIFILAIVIIIKG